ncbi:GtrA family protein [Methanobrevibacter sp. DSM 116169]|uniref:GtrA family protein n=1 Tax=Methanobrevibacter sp. DSM 116169 TaxID=3242727 RepID=UPI0038FCE8B5
MSTINKLFKKRTDDPRLQFFRYIFVGGTAFAIDLSIYFTLVNYFDVHYLIAAIIAFLISVLGNYIMSTKWVFNQDKIDNKLVEFNLFILISTVGLIFTEILLYIFTDLLIINYLISKVIASILVLFWNFTARRLMFYGR